VIREPWIRVHANLMDKPVVYRLAQALRLDPVKAGGHLVAFWGKVAQHAQNGHVASLPDVQLEEWAKWNGKRGAFATWLRGAHLDNDGRVREWDEYAGALELRREKERTRIRQKRANSSQNVAQQPADGCATVGQRTQSVATPARERNETRRELQQRTGADAPAPPNGTSNGTAEPPANWVADGVELWASREGVVSHKRMGATLKPVVDRFGWTATRAGLAEYLEEHKGTRKVEWFAENATRWITQATAPLVDEHGELTERGRRVGAA
jgi:hypothetical protein